MSNPGYKIIEQYLQHSKEKITLKIEFYTQPNYYLRGKNKDIFRIKRNFEVYYLKILSKRTAGQYKPILIRRNPGGRNEIKKKKSKRSNGQQRKK